MSMLLILLTGCSKQTENEASEVVSTKQTITYEVTDESPVMDGNTAIVFEPGETIPILLDGTVKGYLNVNWVQRLGIWDSTNTTAVTVGVKSSYTINLHVDMSESIESAESVILTVKPYTVDANWVVNGSPCCVGWSGFSQVAQLYDNTTAADIEVGVQPEVLDLTGSNVVLKLTDSVGNQYDDVVLSNNYLTTASDGPSLITDGTATVDCINGGRFSLGINNVTSEEHAVEDGAEPTLYYDYQYAVKYLTAPTSDREDLLFDSNNKNLLHTKFVNYLTSDVDSAKLYDSVPAAQRLLYSDKLDTETYVTQEFSDISVGKTFTASSNRAVPETTGNPSYVRVCFEFPEEVEARSLEEMQNFNGRFIVFQSKIGERTLEQFYEEVE